MLYVIKPHKGVLMKRSMLLSLVAVAGVLALAGCWDKCGSCGKQDAAPVEEVATTTTEEQTAPVADEAADHAGHDHADHAEHEAAK